MQFLLVLLLSALVLSGSGVSALRCYTCQDCDETAKLSEMEVCSGSPTSANGDGMLMAASPSQNPSVGPASPAAVPAAIPGTGSAPAPAPAAAIPAVAASNGSEDEDEDYDSDESAPNAPLSPIGIGAAAAGNGVGGAAAGGGGGAVAGGGAPAAAAAAIPAKPGSALASVDSDADEDEDEDEGEDEDDRRRRRTARQVSDIAVCYTARLQRNDTVITNRGCTMARSGNSSTDGACDALFENWSVVGCTLCEENGCNQPIDISIGSMSGSGSRSTSAQWTISALTLLAILVA